MVLPRKRQPLLLVYDMVKVFETSAFAEEKLLPFV